jgi:hypothetical protein
MDWELCLRQMGHSNTLGASEMTIQVGEASPPHRDAAVAEFHVRHDACVDIPAEVYRDNGRLMIALYAREGGIQWEYPLSEFLEAIGKGIGIVGS